MKYLLLMLLAYSCSTADYRNSLRNKTDGFLYKDSSGEYQLKRKFRIAKGEYILNSTLLDPASGKVVEDTIISSKLGRSKKAESDLLLPKVSLHKVWFDKKKYLTKISLDQKSKKYKVLLRSPEKKWKGEKSYDVPKGKLFCWFSMLPECMLKLGLLQKDEKARLFYTMWGSFPYHLEQLTNFSAKTLFVPSYVKFDSIYKGFYRFEVNLAGQTLFYFFKKDYTFEKMFWISQGISITKK